MTKTMYMVILFIIAVTVVDTILTIGFILIVSTVIVLMDKLW